jgi:U3 small nucleolar RNA-associated protein 4
MIKSIEAHDADVLCLALDDSKNIVYSSGVDRKIVRLINVADDQTEHKDIGNTQIQRSKVDWVISGHKRYHSHDVRAMVYLPDRQWDSLITGGVDTTLIISTPTKDFDLMKQHRIGLLPQESPVSYSAANRLIMCHFDDSVRLWQLADPTILGTISDGQRLPHENFKHLITIKSKVLNM